MKFRVTYEHPTDGVGAVTRWSDEPISEHAALALAEEMRSRGEYTTIAVERLARPGGRWEPHTTINE